MQNDFKKKFNFEDRRIEAIRIMEKYPNRIPVIVERVKNTNINPIDKHKFLVPCELTVGQFAYIIRKRVKLKPEDAIFLFVNNTLPPTSSLMSSIYEEHKDQDLFLYLCYSGESVFG